MSQAENWSASGPWKLWAWPRPWCSSPTWPRPTTIRAWPPCLAYRASAKCSSPTRSPASWRTSSRRRCTPSTTPASPWCPTCCSAASTSCARSSCCGSSGGPSLCRVRQHCSHRWADLEGKSRGLAVEWITDRRRVFLNEKKNKKTTLSSTSHAIVTDWLFKLMGFSSPSKGSATFTSTTRWPWSSTHGWTWWSSPSGGALFRMSPVNICTLHPIWFSVSKWNHFLTGVLQYFCQLWVDFKIKCIFFIREQIRKSPIDDLCLGLQFIPQEFANLQVTRDEFLCMKALILLNTGEEPFSNYVRTISF